MQNEGRILGILSESLKTQDKMLQQIISGNERLSKVEEELVKLNLQTNENTRAIIKLADRLEVLVDHEKRIAKLEAVVLK